MKDGARMDPNRSIFDVFKDVKLLNTACAAPHFEQVPYPGVRLLEVECLEGSQVIEYSMRHPPF